MVSGKQNEGNGPWVIAENGRLDEPADYEKAISATGYGVFNLLLLLAALPAGWSAVFDITSAAFILPAVECVFELTLFRKGVLVSIVYLGIMVSGVLWDFVLQDSLINHLGKRNLLLLGLVVDSICNIASAFVNSYYIFLLLKFISGLIVGGPLTLLMSYLGEFHAAKYQLQFNKWAGFLMALSYIIPAALAIIIMPYDSHFYFTISDNIFVTWQVYLLIISIPSVLGLVTMSLIPGSPKVMMYDGRHQDALKSFKRIYSMNTWKSGDSYPIKALWAKEELQSQSTGNVSTVKSKIRETWSKIKMLFSKPYLLPMSIIIFLQFGSMLGLHTMRLWVPQLFTILNNFGRKFRAAYPSNETLTMCEMLVPSRFSVSNLKLNYSALSDSCSPSHIDPAVYINSTIIATSTVVFAFLIGFVTTTRARKEIILLMTFLLSITCSFGANWAQLVPYMLVLSATIVVTMRIAGNIVIAINAEVIPQHLRSIAVSIVNAIGNLAVVVGNFVFSSLLEIECIAAFMSMGCLMLACATLVFFLPKPLSSGAVSNRQLGKY